MAKFTVVAEVTVVRTYETVVTREADSLDEALEGARWEATGLGFERLERMRQTDPQTQLLESFVQDTIVRDLEEVSEDGEDGASCPAPINVRLAGNGGDGAS